MDDWENLNETSVVWKKKKKDFYSHLNIEEVTDADDAHTKGVCNDFEIKIRRMSRFLCSKRYIIVNWCIWELQKYVS